MASALRFTVSARPVPAARRAPRPAAALPLWSPVCTIGVPPTAVPLPSAAAVAALAEAAPGSVDAPVWAVVGGAVVVTAAALAIAAGLKGGTEAADQMFERDRKSGRRR